MPIRKFISCLTVVAVLAAIGCSAAFAAANSQDSIAGDTSAAEPGAKRPNIVWIVSEDNSQHYLRLFDPGGVPTPNIERMAAEGLLYERAFSNSPVCSVARTTLATGVYAPRLGTQYHRRARPVPMPPGWKLFQQYLSDAGYFTTNNSKTDYNVAAPDAWHESGNHASWRNRPHADQPFFHMESHDVSHESSLHVAEGQMQDEHSEAELQQLQLAPYHPDTRLFRYTRARYHNQIQQVDQRVGRTLNALDQDGLLQNTFVFYFGDHGGVLPRSKGYLYEAGLHIPLVVRIPERWRQRISAIPGTRIDGFVEFVDFAPTVMYLAGVEIPEHLDGRLFPGIGRPLKVPAADNETFGYADRFDERYELVRTLRLGRWKYHRNYQAHFPDGLQNNYRYQMPAYEEWRQLYLQQQLNERQRAFFEPKAAEALYDLESDPHETMNLAAEPAMRDVLLGMRNRLRQRLRDLPDLSFLPESIVVAGLQQDPVAFGLQQRDRISALIDTADLALEPVPNALPKLREAMQSADSIRRQWALTACAVLGNAAESLADDAEMRLQDHDLLTRLRAAEFLGRIRAVYLRDTLGYPMTIGREDVTAVGDSIDRRLRYLAVPQRDQLP